MRKVISACVLVIFLVVGWYFVFRTEEKKDLSVALFQAPASLALAELVPEFEAQTGIKVAVEMLPYAELRAKIEQQLVSNSGNYDVVMADSIWIPSFAERGALAELDVNSWKNGAYDFDDLLPELDDYLSKFPKNGKRYGMPFMSNTHMMAYRPDVVAPVAAELGLKLPGTSASTAWTWQNYLDVARRITAAKKDHPQRPFGTSLQARAGAWIVYEWNSVLFGFVEAKAERNAGLPMLLGAGNEAMAYYASLYKQAPQEALTWGHEEETSAMCSGQTAMDATSNVELAANLLRKECRAAGPIAFAYPPTGKNGKGSPDMGGFGLLVTKQSTMVSAASRFVLWAASRDIHTRIVMKGGSPIRRSQLTNKDILEKFPYLSFYEKLIKDSVYRARIPRWPELEDIISRELTSVMQGQKPASVAAQSVEDWVVKNNLRQ